MLVRDGAADQVDAADRESVGGAFGEVGADQRGLSRERNHTAGGAPALPLAPRPVVHGAGGLGMRRCDRVGDPDGLPHAQSSGQMKVVGLRCPGMGSPTGCTERDRRHRSRPCCAAIGASRRATRDSCAGRSVMSGRVDQRSRKWTPNQISKPFRPGDP